MFKPISKEHSISRVSAKIFLAQSFVKPEDIFTKLNNDSLLPKYHKKGLVRSKTINVNSEGIKSLKDDINGFVFEEFNDLGKSINVFEVDSNNNNTKSKVNIETKYYTRWDSFKERFCNDLDSLFIASNFYIEAISLTYVDEFIWDSIEKIPVKSIFNTDSELFNSNFIDSHNGTLVTISQSEIKKGENLKEEKTEILFNNDVKKVIINHTFAIRLEDVLLYKKDYIEALFDVAHTKNKDLLNKILTEDVKRKIKLV